MYACLVIHVPPFKCLKNVYMYIYELTILIYVDERQIGTLLFLGSAKLFCRFEEAMSWCDRGLLLDGKCEGECESLCGLHVVES